MTVCNTLIETSQALEKFPYYAKLFFTSPAFLRLQVEFSQ